MNSEKKPASCALSLFVLFLIAPGLSASAREPAQDCGKIRPDQEVRSTGKRLLLVTHPGFAEFDRLASSYVGLRNTYADLAHQGDGDTDTVFLAEHDTPSQYFFPTCRPDHFVVSKAGEVSLKQIPSVVIVAGGFFSACLRRTISDVLAAWNASPGPGSLRLILPLEAIYERPTAYDGKDSEFERKFGERLRNYQQVTGTPKMNLGQVARLMGQEEFLALIRAYFIEEIDVPGIGRSRLPLPASTSVRLKALYRSRLETYLPELAFSIEYSGQLLSPQNPKRTLEVILADEAYLLGNLD